MKLILQALKSILRKIEASIDNAQTTANNAKSEVDSKMSATNPVASGSFSMGRASGSTVGRYSHAEGFNATASGYCSHAEGSSTTASGYCSHAEGNSTTASGYYAHSEGEFTKAIGDDSHSEGKGTIAKGKYQHVQGRYNVEDRTTVGTYAHIVGNGTDDGKRSNAHTLDWNGNAWFAGEVKVGGTGKYDHAAKTLATTEDIPAVDSTLTQSGQAADAKAVGDRLSSLSEEIVTTSESKVAAHNTGTDTHSDIRLLIQGLTDRLNALADSDDTTLDQLSEVVVYIKSNRSLIEAITTSKVSVADIVDNLTTNASNKPLSAAQGVVIKTLIDALRNDKLDAAELTNAINTALAQAKESGEFDGKSAYEIWLEAGNTGTEADFLASLEGADGHSPVRGTDYWTETDKAEIVQQVLESIGTPIFGVVDSDNNVILTGQLEDGTYSIKYEMENGNTVNIGKLVLDTRTYYSITNNLTDCTNSNSATEVVEGGSYSATISANSGYELKTVSVAMGGSAVSVTDGVISIASVTGDIVITAVAEAKVTIINQLPISTDANGNLFVGTNGEKGYKTGYRLSTSSGNESALSSSCVTGFIPMTVYDILRIKNITLNSNDGYNGLVLYDSNRKYLAATVLRGYAGVTVSDNVYTIYLQSLNNSANCAFVRFSCASITENTIVTVNQVIT